MSDSLSFKIKSEYLNQVPEILSQANANIKKELLLLEKHGFHLILEEIEFDNASYGPDLQHLVNINLHAASLSSTISAAFYYQKIIDLAKQYAVTESPSFYSQAVPVLYYDSNKNYILPNNIVYVLMTHDVPDGFATWPVIRENVLETKVRGTNFLQKFYSKFKHREMEKFKQIIQSA